MQFPLFEFFLVSPRLRVVGKGYGLEAVCICEESDYLCKKSDEI